MIFIVVLVFLLLAPYCSLECKIWYICWSCEASWWLDCGRRLHQG